MQILTVMGKSFLKMYVHIVFSTKYRQKLIVSSIENELFSYLGGVCKELNCQPIIVGGYVDHVHILCRLSPIVPVAKLTETTKSHSSKWIKTRSSQFRNFFWQTGYGAFSVGEERIDGLTSYIKNQRQHHEVKSFQDEFRELLKENNIEFDERYVWD